MKSLNRKKIPFQVCLLFFALNFSFTLGAMGSDLEPIFEAKLEEQGDSSNLTSVVEDSADPRKLTLKLKGGTVIEFSPTEVGESGIKKYESLGEQEREGFLRNRELLVGIAGKFLETVKTPIGFSKKMGARFVTPKSEEEKGRRQDILQKTSQDVGLESIQKMLKEFEKSLWDYAPFVSKINEVGTSVEAGVAGGGKLGRLGAFVVLGAGVSINMDPKERAIVLELFQDVEWAKSALPGYIGAEAFASLFGNAAYNDWNEPLSIERGAALSLPGLAGCVTDKNARLGIAKGLGVGFPGAAVLTSSIVRIPLIRVGVSPKWPALFKIKVLGGEYLSRPLKACSEMMMKGCSELFRVLGRHQ